MEHPTASCGGIFLIMDLSIIILSYKSQKDMERLLPSVFASKGINFNHQVSSSHLTSANCEADKSANYKGGIGRIYTAEIIVVDNGSNDGTYEWLVEKSYNCNNFQQIQNSNTGFAHGNNLGIKIASGKYILLLNPDTELQPDTLETMLDFMETRPNVGISGCKIIKPDGKLDLACRRRFPNPWNSSLRLLHISNKNYNMLDTDEKHQQEIDSVMGAFLLIRKSVMEKIGLLDEQFFMYGEDLDWCWRCKEAGFKVWYNPKTYITHFKGSSSSKVAFKALKWFHNAMWIFYRKHYKKDRLFLFNWLVFIGIYLRLLVFIMVNLFKSKPSVSK